jgi:hypothetical protein
MAKDVSATALEGLLLDARDALETYNAAEEEDGGETGASECIAGCDQNLKDCLESWGEIIHETDIDLFDGEAEDQTDGGGGAVGSIDDNPLDVEQSDAGDTGASDDSEDTHQSGGLDQLTILESGVLAGICALTFSMCLLACTLEAGPG